MSEIEFFEKFENDRGDMTTFHRQKSVTNYHKIKDYANQGYTVDGYNTDTGEYRFVKLTNLDFGFGHVGKLQYRITQPKTPSTSFKNKLVVVFPPFLIYDVNARGRMFGREEIFRDLKKHLPRNTYILEIADTNLISGSFFMNTENYPDYISDVQNLIKKTYQDLKIDKARVLLMGSSRGGFGAVLHALAGDYYAVAHEPALTVAYLHNRDYSLLRDQIPTSFGEVLEPFMRSDSKDAKITIMSSSDSQAFWPHYQVIWDKRVQLIDLAIAFDTTNGVSKHIALVEHGGVPYFLANIIKTLESMDASYVELNQSVLNPVRFDVKMPLSTRYFTFAKVGDSLEIALTQVSEKPREASFLPMIPFVGQETYEIDLEIIETQVIEFYLTNQVKVGERIPFEVVKQDGDVITKKATFKPMSDWFLVGI
ncbi:XcbB/CpsF family capsular polysaccharide biosynthesis protein [Pseudolactococcus insecticola]|uniref:Uncharacterized protein n=1 Tax=Pseudolactococcus insecticola TaxID=2709158 RepID=A0A6A0B752_9LACT|nr:XcbB/CpsF family capsular polysaccharide biosynthesis protein [Lactococcus insecticola]GFH40308.1 hypothetical protein Hs20B_07060 [Lactococcus insecticola]